MKALALPFCAAIGTLAIILAAGIARRGAMAKAANIKMVQ